MGTSLSRLQNFYGDFDTEPLLHVMITQEFRDKIALISSFGADAALLIQLVANVDPTTPILFLETGKHFKETLEYVEELRKYFGLKDVRHLKPDIIMLDRIDPKGDLWKFQPDRCCWLRKVEPLDRALKEMGFEAVITGRKRYQTKERETIDTIELDDKGKYRINPLALWSKERFKKEIKERNLPQHPLVAKGYPSIGCEPCTIQVKPGEDERSGRWAHTIDLAGAQKTECGIHIPTDQATNWSV